MRALGLVLVWIGGFMFGVGVCKLVTEHARRAHGELLFSQGEATMLFKESYEELIRQRDSLHVLQRETKR